MSACPVHRAYHAEAHAIHAGAGRAFGLSRRTRVPHDVSAAVGGGGHAGSTGSPRSKGCMLSCVTGRPMHTHEPNIMVCLETTLSRSNPEMGFIGMQVCITAHSFYLRLRLQTIRNSDWTGLDTLCREA